MDGSDLSAALPGVQMAKSKLFFQQKTTTPIWQ